MRIVCIILAAFIIFLFLYYILALAFSGNKKVSKKNDRDYWYSHPHYHVFRNGEKINLSEYFTYDEWNNISESQKMQKLLYLEHNLYDKIDKNIIIN